MSKLEEQRALIDSQLSALPVSEEVGALLDRRVAALANDPNQRKYTLQEIVERRGLTL